MGKYLHYFLTKGEFAKKYFSEDYEKHWTSLTVAGYKSNYDKARKKLAKTPLTLVPLTDNSTTFTFVIGATVNTDTLQSISYSIDGGQTWTTTNNTDGTAVNVAVTVTDRQPVMWKGVGKAISVSDSVYSRITSNRNFAAFGNPLSLLSERYNLTDLYPFPWALANLFRGNTYLIHASDLMLTPRRCGSYCYSGMFYGCSNLTIAPALPATSVAPYCYNTMFQNCSKLTIGPTILPAITLESNCYLSMFNGCSKLTSVPTLPATTLAVSCYNQMFKNCTSLTNPPALPATKLASNCYDQMFAGCTSLVNAPNLPATTVAQGCYANMFNGCTSITTMPTINLTAMQNNALKGMMRGCTSLVNVPDILPWTTLASGCFQELFYGCTSLAKAPKLPAQTLVANCYNSMFYNCSNINSVTALFTTNPNSVSTCNNNWLYGVSATGTFIMSGNAEWDPDDYRGVSGVPEGWTVQYITPTLVTGDEKTNYVVPSNGVDIEIGGYDLLTNPSVTLVDSDNVFTMTPGLGNTDEWEAWEWMTSPHAHGNDFIVTCSDYSQLHTATIVVSSPGTSDLTLTLINNEGTLPNTYRRVWYVEADGNQQIDLNLNMFGTAPVDYGVQLVGYLDSTSVAYGTLLANVSETNPYPGTAIRKDNNNNNVHYRANGANTIIKATNTLFSVNYTGTNTSAFTCKTTLFGAINTSDSNWWRFAKGRIYACKIIVNNTVVRNLIPCVEIATSTAGLYDIVNSTFYTSETDPLLYAI